MLHENAKQRLRRLVPHEFEVEWFDPLEERRVTETITLDPQRQIRFARQGTPPQYPCIYLNVSPQGTPRGDLDHIFSDGVYKEEVPEDDTVAYRKYTAAPQRSTLTVTTAVKKGTKKIPKRVVADTLAIQTWHEFRFDSDHLKEHGTTPSGEELEYAWPMDVQPNNAGMDDTSGIFDELGIERRVFELSVEYAYFDVEDVPATDSIVWRFGVDKDYDGEPEEWSDWQSTNDEVDPADHIDPDEYEDDEFE